jgi:hypothetical protein
MPFVHGVMSVRLFDLFDLFGCLINKKKIENLLQNATPIGLVQCLLTAE